MNAIDESRGQFDVLAEEFVDRYRRGERPAVAEYADRFPELASEIRELFPALVFIEELGPEADTAEAVGGSPVACVPAPERLGDYRILSEIGRGGMGVVYEAVQEPLGRHVALKVLPAGPRVDDVQLNRFRREASVAARLHHSNIVPVHAVGADGGSLYYAMQFIEGKGLNVVLREIRDRRGMADKSGAGDPIGKTSGSETADLSVTLAAEPLHRFCQSVARLGAQAADALAYAHSQNVIHRDIKPSNLLLDARRTLWIADFGLAKAEDSDDLTRTGELVGTMRYMAPERFTGIADARGDIYALGTTLYEMLTLRPAFPDTDRLRLMADIRGGAVAAPRKIQPLIPRDLEMIVLKAMAREPGDRYPNAEEFAADLRSFLAGQPVLARRSSPAERLWRWARREPLVAALSSALMLLLICGTTVASVLAVRASDSAGAEHTARTAAESDRDRATKARARAREVLDAITSDLTQTAIGQQLTITPELRKLYENFVPYYEELLNEPADNRAGRAARANVCFRLATIRGELGQGAAAVPAFRRAIDIVDQLGGEDAGDKDVQYCRARYRQSLGYYYLQDGRLDEAERPVREAVAIFKEIAAEPDSSYGTRLSLADAYSEFGWLSNRMGHFEDAVAACRAGLAVCDELAVDGPAKSTIQEYRAHLHSTLAVAENKLHDPVAADSDFRKGVELYAAVTKASPANRHLRANMVSIETSWAALLTSQSQFAEAETIARSAVKQGERLTMEFPAVALYRDTLATNYNELGNLLLVTGKRQEALEIYGKACSLGERLVAEWPGVHSYALSLGGVYCNMAKWHKEGPTPAMGLQYVDKAEAMLQPIAVAQPRDQTALRFLRNCHWVRAAIFVKLQRWAEAANQWDQMTALATGDFAIWGRSQKAISLAHAGKNDQAIAEAEAVATLAEVQALTLYNCACALAVAGRPGDGDRCAIRAVELLRRSAEKGFNDFQQMQSEPDLAAIRGRSDFAAILADFVKSPKK